MWRAFMLAVFILTGALTVQGQSRRAPGQRLQLGFLQKHLSAAAK